MMIGPLPMINTERIEESFGKSSAVFGDWTGEDKKKAEEEGEGGGNQSSVHQSAKFGDSS
jgi:hypothetical protein